MKSVIVRVDIFKKIIINFIGQKHDFIQYDIIF
jgi:hypothetical protein